MVILSYFPQPMRPKGILYIFKVDIIKLRENTSVIAINFVISILNGIWWLNTSCKIYNTKRDLEQRLYKTPKQIGLNCFLKSHWNIFINTYTYNKPLHIYFQRKLLYVRIQKIYREIICQQKPKCDLIKALELMW